MSFLKVFEGFFFEVFSVFKCFFVVFQVGLEGEGGRLVEERRGWFFLGVFFWVEREGEEGRLVGFGRVLVGFGFFFFVKKLKNKKSVFLNVFKGFFHVSKIF